MLGIFQSWESRGGGGYLLGFAGDIELGGEAGLIS
jgi:hypothetical protein